MTALLNPVTLLAFAALALAVRSGADGVRGLWSWCCRPAIRLALIGIVLAHVVLRIGFGYLVPGDFAQEIVAVAHYDKTGSFYSNRIQDDLRAALEDDPLGVEAMLPAAVRRALERRREAQPALYVVQAHPPVLLTLARPLVNVLGARLTFLAVSLMTVSAAAAAAAVLLAWRQVRMASPAWWLGLVLVLGWQPVLAALTLGQVSVILAALVIAGWMALRAGRDITGGSLIGIAAALKLYPAILLGALLPTRWRGAAAGAAAIAFACVGAAAASGPGQFAAFRQAAGQVAATYGTAPNNYSLWSRMGLLSGGTPPPWIVGSVGGALVALTFVAGMRRSGSPPSWQGANLDLDVAAFACLATLLPPVVWQHYCSMLLLPLAVTGRMALRPEARWLAVAWCGILVLLSVPDTPYWAMATLHGWMRPLASLCSPTAAVIALWVWCARARPSQVPAPVPC